HPFDGTADVIRFIVLAGLVSSLVSALVATPSLTLAGFNAWGNFLPFAWTWWLGDATGILVVTPMILVWLRTPAPRGGSVWEAIALLVALASVGQIAFGVFGGEPKRPPMTHLFLPLFVWAVLRFGARGAVTATFVAYMMAMVATPLGRGP